MFVYLFTMMASISLAGVAAVVILTCIHTDSKSDNLMTLTFDLLVS